ncbi:MAG: redoxin domain-containing protein [Planctomycetes bacterium]|nr:redoxin domain-containing protein [Planctomycetota bacterium]
MNGALVPLEVGARAPQLDLARLQPALAAPPRYLLLCFLPLAGAPVCAHDAKGLATVAAEWRGAGVPIVVSSVDGGDHLRRFLDEQGGAALHALSDGDLALARAFGVAWPQRFAARASFLLAADGDRHHVVRAAALHPIAFARPLVLIRYWRDLVAPSGAAPARG